ncbi:hypothetical protein BDK51DRAFT_50868 [Blyttiomyces helicus]|uniref:Pleiotropic ABC efflux transporter N-terminal domain-containing protein n=1 Tax=Blyttiomyces helicus TaxID=388810 RepID=A0A4P9WHX7_9FUNG|nr:hypothetical protein BDK51DRAFT_50868 [Blyttiomyces helicus]|eukprot:RKO92449.1 hypothetical protein BDK51DRAFT_50868 [Blyttiomyces helicus]
MSLLPEDASASSTLFPDTVHVAEIPSTEPAVEVASAIAEFEAAKADVASLSSTAADKDVEAAPVSDRFDLQDFLEGGVRKAAEAGVKRQHLGVTFRDLTVIGEGADASSIATLVTPFVFVAKALNPVNWFSHASRGTDFNIINKATGYVKEGEMLLVLGRPGSGCSTFLRVLANERDSYKSIEGTVSYGGISPQGM